MIYGSSEQNVQNNIFCIVTLLLL